MISMTVIYYEYPKCTTCRKGKKWLTDSGITFDAVDLVENTPSEEQLKEMVEASGEDIQKFFNTRGKVYREENLKERLPAMSYDEKIALLASNGMLIKRPITYGDGKVTLGFKEETFEKVWG